MHWWPEATEALTPFPLTIRGIRLQFVPATGKEILGMLLTQMQPMRNARKNSDSAKAGVCVSLPRKSGLVEKRIFIGEFTTKQYKQF